MLGTTVQYNYYIVAERKMSGLTLKLGDIVPNFVAETTEGKMDFHAWLEGRWTLDTFNSQ